MNLYLNELLDHDSSLAPSDQLRLKPLFRPFEFLFAPGAICHQIGRGPGDAVAAEEGRELAVPEPSALPAEKTELVLIGGEINHVLRDAQPAGHGKEPRL